MKVNVNAFIAVLLCTVLLEGLWLLSSRDVSEKDIWSPHHIYQSIGGGATYSSSTSSYAPSSSVGVLALSPSRLGAVRTPSYYAPSYATYDGLQSPLIQSSASAVSPISYTASSAQYHSFGGGSAVAGGSSYGGMRSAAPQQSVGASSLSIPSMPNYAMASRQAAPMENAADIVAINEISSAAAAAYNPSSLSYNPLSANLHQLGASSVSYGSYSSAIQGISNRRKAAHMGSGIDALLSSLGANEGFLYEYDGIRYYDMTKLQAWYEAAQASGEFSSANMPGLAGLSWDDFLEQFWNIEGQDKHQVPVGEPWIVLLFALCYVAYIAYRRSSLSM